MNTYLLHLRAIMKTEIEQKASFNIMRYAQCWEDADVLVEALDINSQDVCLSIASAGENTFSLLSKSPKKVIAVDMNPIQLAAVELRKYVYLHLPHEAMLIFHGAKKGTVEQRLNYYNVIKPYLSEETQVYWEGTNFLEVGYGSVGKFEKYFALFKDKIIPLIHSKKTIAELFSITDIHTQREFYAKKWNNLRWKWLFKIFFSRKFMGLMGRDPAFFNYVEGSVADKILSRTELAFNHVLARENPYLDWILHGEFRYALPHALREENYEAIRQNLDKLHLHLGSIESYLDTTDEKITKYNLSDIFEYMSIGMYETLMQKLMTSSVSGGKMAYWNMLAPRSAVLSQKLNGVLEGMDTTELFLKDKAFFYSQFICETLK
jgi:S-adenosylmethionine-diacylglycerol 3-amino-3-carboxypropyl transferase